MKKAFRRKRSACGRSLRAENVSRKNAVAPGPLWQPPSRRLASDRVLRTREAGKSHLRYQLCGHSGPDPSHAPEAVDRSERAEGVPVGDDSLRQGGTDAIQRLDQLGGSSVHIHSSARDGSLLTGRRPAATRANPSRGPGRIHPAELILKCERCRRIGRRVLGDRANRANPGAQRDHSGEKDQGFALGGGGHSFTDCPSPCPAHHPRAANGTFSPRTRQLRTTESSICWPEAPAPRLHPRLSARTQRRSCRSYRRACDGPGN